MAEQRIDVIQELREQNIDVLNANTEQAINIGREPSVLHGIDGVSPIATVTQTETGATISITDRNGTTTADILNGEQGPKGDKGDPGTNGEDGFSPTATVAKSGDTATITITDKNGTTTAQISDGAGASITVDDELSSSSTNPVQNKTINSALSAKADSSDIPTKTSDLANDGADSTSTYVESDDLATVATSGSYNDLSDKPTIPAAQVNSDWSANSGVAQILNKPTLATVATTGDYDDLINKPTPITVDSALSWTSQNPVENQAIRKTIYVKNSSDDKEAGIDIAFSDPNLNPYVHLGSKTSATRGVNSVGIGNNAEASAVRSVAIGNAATASKREGVALGPNATAGQYSLSIGYHTETVPNYSTAVGPYAKVLTGATNATAIGYKSEASEAETVSVGKSTNKRRIVNVADGTTATDAATVGQIPTKTSDLTNDGADNTSTYVEADELATVATSGSYNDLTNKPTIPTAGTITSGSTGYATGGDVYNAIGDVETILSTLNNGGGAQ